jgi:Flp pilus assembly protein TadG
MRPHRRLREERGAAAVEFALLTPVLFMVIFAIIGFGLAFMQLQTIRGAVREGARISAVGATTSEVQAKVAEASTGLVDAGQVTVTSCPGRDTTVDTTASFDTGLLNGGQGIVVTIPLLPDIHITPVVTAQFRCET